MKDVFNTLDKSYSKYIRWSKGHKKLSILTSLVLISFLWPLIIAYFIARYIYKHSQKSFSAKAVPILFAFGMLFNILWIGSTQSTYNNSLPDQNVQELTKAEQLEVNSIDEAPEQPELYKVLETVDGDTIKVSFEGKTETVRLIGVDTPESVDPRTTVECFAKESSEYTKKALLGKSVQLESDDSQLNRDKYSRLLRYVILEDGTNFNKSLINDGYAYEYTYEVPYKYQTEFKDAESSAKSKELGLWASSSCNGSRSNTESTTLQAPPAQQSPSTQQNESGSTSCVIKGNISTSTGEKIYHVPGQRFYDKTIIDTSKGERYFCSEAEAVNAGWRKSKV